MFAAPLPVTITLDPQQDRLLRRTDVELIVGLGRSSIYAAVKAGTFPAPVHVTQRAVAWRKSAIDAWLISRQSARTDVPDDTAGAAALSPVMPTAPISPRSSTTRATGSAGKARNAAAGSTRNAAAQRRVPASNRSARSTSRATA